MSQAARNALLGTVLAATSAFAADVSFQSTTYAQYWKQDLLGEQRNVVMFPWTQFLDVNVTKLGQENLSFSLYGWGRKEFGPRSSSLDGKKNSGELVTAYLRYHFNKANGELMAGRMFVYDCGSVEQIDGVSGRADLVHNLNLSLFVGKPSHNYLGADKRTILAGTRLGAKLDNMGEVGVSLLMDGPTPHVSMLDQTKPYPSRRLVNLDAHLMPTPLWDINARTSYHMTLRELAEQDYAVRYRIHPSVSITGFFLDRQFRSYFAGTSLPQIFKQDIYDAQTSWGGKLQWGKMGGPVEVVADYKRSRRERLGISDRIGGELRFAHSKPMNIRYGVGYHRIIGGPSRMNQVALNNPNAPFYCLSHHELRAWTFVDWERMFASLDGVYHLYDERNHPALNHTPVVFEGMASLGWRPKSNLTLSGDLIYSSNPSYRREFHGALRVEYRFGGAQ